jgi:tetratricopeptide (TPR) repeat protein
MAEYELAASHLDLAYQCFERMGCPSHLILGLARIAETMVYRREYEKANTLLSRAIALSADQVNDEIACCIREIKGRLLLARGAHLEAEMVLAEAIETSHRKDYRFQKLVALRTLGQLCLAQHRHDEAATLLLEALQEAVDFQASLLEMEINVLLAEAIHLKDPLRACSMVLEVEAQIGDRPLLELKSLCRRTRELIKGAGKADYFILSDAKMPSLQDAKAVLLRWLWDRALLNTKGNAKAAAELLKVTPAYIRQLTRRIVRSHSRAARGRGAG